MTKHARRNKNLCVPDASSDLAAQQSVPQPRGNAAAQDAMNGWVEPEWSRNLGPEDVHPHRYSGEPLPDNAAPPRRRVRGGQFSHIDVGDGGIDIAPIDVRSPEGEIAQGIGPHANLELGQINHRDTRDEARRWGVRGEIGLASALIGDEDEDYVRITCPEASGELSWDEEDGFTTEAGGFILEGEGGNRFDSLADTRVNYALRGGMEGGFHTTNSDSDGDGYTEHGFQFNAGIASVGMSTELFSRAWAGLWD